VVAVGPDADVTLRVHRRGAERARLPAGGDDGCDPRHERPPLVEAEAEGTGGRDVIVGRERLRAQLELPLLPVHREGELAGLEFASPDGWEDRLLRGLGGGLAAGFVAEHLAQRVAERGELLLFEPDTDRVGAAAERHDAESAASRLADGLGGDVRGQPQVERLPHLHHRTGRGPGERFPAVRRNRDRR